MEGAGGAPRRVRPPSGNIISRERRPFNPRAKFARSPSRLFRERRIVTLSSGQSERETFMQHDSHIAESHTGAMPKIIAILAVVLGLCAVGAYVVYGSGMWNPPAAHSSY
jgi:hypothetical protein